MSQQKCKLRSRHLNRFDVWGMVIGSIIGWGAFTLPGQKFLPEAGLINTLVALMVGASLMLFIEAGYHEMLSTKLGVGGEFNYVYRELGRTHAFVVGWSLALAYLSMVALNAGAFIKLLRLLFGEKIDWLYLYSIAGSPVYLGHVLVIYLVIAAFLWLNIRGIKAAYHLQNVVSALLVLIVLSLLVLVAWRSDQKMFIANYFTSQQLKLAEILKVLAIVPFLFVGFDVVPQIAPELNLPARKVTRVTIASIFAGAAVYAALNVIAALSFDRQAALATNWAVADSIVLKVGYLGFSVMLVALFAAISGGINGFMISSSKLIAALSEQHFLGEKWQKQNRYGNYQGALIFVCGINLIAPWLGAALINYLVDLASVLAALTYAYVCYLAQKTASSLLKKLVILSGFGVSLAFLVLLLYPKSPSHLHPVSYVCLALWVLAGLAIYGRQKWLRK